MTTVLFSGKFDPPHISHFITIARLLKKYDKVIVVVLDYDEQFFPVAYRCAILTEALSHIEGRVVDVVVNNTHFGQITPEEFDLYGADVYASGNLEVLKHIDNLGCIDTIYVERAYQETAGDARLATAIRKLVDEV